MFIIIIKITTNDKQLKRLNHNMANIIEIYDASIPKMQTEIGQYLAGLTTLYVSIGSKFNEPRVRFSENPGREFTTNSRQQMYPRFLRGRSPEERIRVIIVDDFRNKPLYETNRKLLKQVAEENATIILINHSFVKSTLTAFTTIIAELCVTNQLPSERVMIANFVKHMNTPNPIEGKAEEMIPEIIQSVLDLPAYAEYTYCFHQWFGYRFYTYHFVYNYKKYQHMSYILYKELEDLIQLRLKNSLESITVIQQPELVGFIDSIYDISLLLDEPHSGGAIATSMKEYMIQNGLVLQGVDMPSSPSVGLTILE